jgi:intein/homing endonuclease
MLKMEISGHHKIWSELVAKHSKLSILCPRDHGKTLISLEKVILANGDRVAIKDLKPGDQVFSVGPDYKARVNAVEVMQLCGLKQCVEIKTRTGREIKAALTHPFLKYSGWTKAEDLKVGDRLAVPRNIPIDLPGYDVSFSEIALLGHVIANGGVTQRFKVPSRKYQALLVRLFSACRLDAFWDEKEGCFSVRGGMDFLERYNLFGKKSVDKSLPREVFRFSKKQLAVFIGHLWSDGDVTFVERNYRGCKGQINIDLCMANEQLVKDVQHLLLRLGILSTFAEKTVKYKKQDGSIAKAWRVSVTGKENQLKWFRLVGCHLFRDDMERCAPFLEGLDSNSQNDQIPNGWKVHLKNTDRWHREHSGIRIDNKYEIGRDKLSRVAEAEDNDKLRELASSDVLWDEIVSIEDIGMHECADIQVERDHNYICNDFFTHNSYFFSFAYVIWRSYYGWIPPLPSKEFKSIPRRSLGYIFSNTQENAISFLGMIRDEILMNPLLKHLIPSRKDQWSKTEIKLSNNTILRARGYGVAVRGGHPSFVIADDVLTDENIYSEIQREKVKDYFYSAMTPMVIPGGQTIVVGCVKPDTFVLTRDGVCRIGDLLKDENSLGVSHSEQKLYDFNQDVYGANGFKNATKYWVNGRCATKKIRTTFGLELEASHRHPILVRKGKGPTVRREAIWKRMDELCIGDMALVRVGQQVYGDRFSDEDLAYFMGLWTAEGSSETCGRLTICTSNETLLNYLDRNPFGLKFSRHQSKSRVQNKEFYDQLGSFGVKFVRAEHKVVPSSILSGTKGVQAAFIRGFVDGDGSSHVRGEMQQVQMSSASKDLIFQIRAMLMNMGMLPSYRIDKPGVSEKVVGKLPSHSLRLSGYNAYKFMKDVGFTVSHKIKAMSAEHVNDDEYWVTIKSIENGECETVDFVIPDDHTFCSNGFISHNTPMHAADLYADLKDNVEYKHCHFSAIGEDGKALWPTRYSFEMLRAREREVGSVRFAREYRCIPVSDASSLFPEKTLQECYRPDLELMTDVPTDLWENYDVFTGIDLALSAKVGADYSVITTLGVDKYKNRRLLDIRRSKGRGMTEQLRDIEEVYHKYRPQKIYIEDNQFQRVFRDQLVAHTDMPVQGFTTTAQKNSLERGVPSLQILFENRKFQIPRKTERDRRLTDILLGELKCFTWVNGKLQGVGSHDDTVMSLYIANEACQSSGFSFSFD